MSIDRVMLLIDADNLSVDVMEQAVHLLHKQHGAVHVRRAYCTAEGALKNQAAFKRLGIKPMVNLATGKNSTDIALAVDAVDLVLAERPDVVVIASSDSDFAPLVQRLREKGCVVRGIGQHGKTGDETQEVYDDYTVIEHRKGAGAGEARPAAARKTGGRSAAKTTGRTESGDDGVAAEVPPAAKKAGAKAPVARKTTAARKTGARSTAGAAASAVAETPESARPPRRSRAAPAPAPAPVSSPVSSPVVEAVAAAPAEAAPAVGRPARKVVARKSTSRKAAAASAEAAPAAEAVAVPEAVPAPAVTPADATAPRRASASAVLACLPEVAAGQSLALNVAVQRLREAQLLGRNSSSLKLFSQLGDRFELVPANKPSQVRLRR